MCYPIITGPDSITWRRWGNPRGIAVWRGRPGGGWGTASEEKGPGAGQGGRLWGRNGPREMVVMEKHVRSGARGWVGIDG